MWEERERNVKKRRKQEELKGGKEEGVENIDISTLPHQVHVHHVPDT